MPVVFAAQDLRAFCRDMGSPVVFNGIATYPDDGTPVLGLFDRPVSLKFDTGGFGGGASVALPELRLPFNAFAVMPRAGDQLTVNGTPYLVETPTAEDDGAFLCYPLQLTS